MKFEFEVMHPSTEPAPLPPESLEGNTLGKAYLVNLARTLRVWWPRALIRLTLLL